MILMGALEGVGTENLDFFGPKVGTGTRIFVVDRLKAKSLFFSTRGFFKD
jgi:hypothetical protein